MINFIIGSPGSGKTSHCLQQVREMCIEDPLGPPVIILVPEQMTHLTEQALLSEGLDGTVRARVFSFSRLAHWVFSQGPAASLPMLNEVHRRVLVTAIVSRLRRTQSSDSLLQLRSIDRAVTDLLTEIRQNRMRPETLEELAREVAESDSALARKLNTIAHVVSEYGRSIQDRFEDPEDNLSSLRHRIIHLEAMQGAQVFVDGFYSFTPVETEVLRGLVHRCTKTSFVLPIDVEDFVRVRNGGVANELHRTFMIEETLEELLALATDEQIEIGESVVLPHPRKPVRFAADGLKNLQRSFLSHIYAPPLSDEFPEIKFAVASDKRGETRLAAEQLLDWRRQQGWQWGEMAVITRRLDDYTHTLKEHCAAANIPLFIDRHESLETHPVLQGLLTALEGAFNGWESELLLGFAKTGLCGIDEDAIAHLELYLSASPQGEGEWMSNQPWKAPVARSPFEDERTHSYFPFDIDEIDETRRTIAHVLNEMTFAIRNLPAKNGTITLHEFAEVISHFLESVVPDPDEDSLSVLKQIGAHLTSMVEAAGSKRIEKDVLHDVVREIIGTLKMPRIPPILNQVMLAQADRSRLPRIKGAIVLGLAEGQFPLPTSNSSLLSDYERETLHKLAISSGRRTARLNPSSRRVFAREGIFGWMAMTRASHALTLVRPLSGDGGDKLAPSLYWEEARRLFPQNQEENEREAFSLHGAMHAREIAASLCRQIFETDQRNVVPPSDFNPRLFSCKLDDKSAHQFESVFASARHRNESFIDPALAEELIGDEIRTSVSALESFASCPFQYFMRSMIGADVLDTAEVTAADLGNLAHAVLKELTDGLIKEEKGFQDIDRDQIPDLVSHALVRPYARLKASRLFRHPTERAMAELLKRHLIELVRSLAEAGEKLNSHPLVTEERFGGKGNLEAVEFDVALTKNRNLRVVVRGQVDRVDVMEDENGTRWLALVDYKLNAKRASWAELADGKSLQLPVYLLVLEKNREKLSGSTEDKIGGAFYVPIIWSSDKVRQFRGVLNWEACESLLGEPPDCSFLSTAKNAGKKTSGHGDIISTNQFTALMEMTRSSIERHIVQIARGEIEIRPAWVGKNTPCGWCAYRDSCRLDYSMNERRLVPPLKRVDAIEQWLGPP